MTDGVEIPLQSMLALSNALRDIIAEYEDAGARTGELTDAIGRPQGDIRLQRAAEDFESESMENAEKK